MSGTLASRHDRGSAMVLVVVLVVVLLGLGIAFLASTTSDNAAALKTEHDVLSKQAAAAGLDKTRVLLYENRSGGGNWNNALNASYSWFHMSGYQVPGEAATTASASSSSAYYETAVATQPASLSTTESNLDPALFYGRNFKVGEAIYNVLVVDDSEADGDPVQDTNDQVVVFTTVAAPADVAPGQSRTVLGVHRTVVFFQPTQFVPNHAITVGGNLILGGNPTVQGTMGSVHANGDFRVQGSPSISQQGSATGSVIIVGSPPTPPGGWNSGAAVAPIPAIDPVQYVSRAKYYLENDGKVYDNTTSPMTLLATSDWNGFNWTASGGWKKENGTTPPAGGIYVNGDVKITGGGTDTAPWHTTLFVNGSIDMSGNPRIQPYEQNVTMLARGDIKIRGNASAYPGVNGLIATHEQVDIAGTPQFTGSVIAEDAEDVRSLVTSISAVGAEGSEEEFMSIMGNFDLTYDGGMETFLTAAGTSVRVRSWDKYR